MSALAELFPDEDYRFHLGLRRGEPARYFQPTADAGSLRAERRRWLMAEPERYGPFLPEAEPLLAEVWALAGAWQSLPPDDVRGLVQSSVPERGRLLGQLWEPDFLLLRPDAAGVLKLVGGCVCFPSSWSLAEKLGQPLPGIHAPVPELNAHLAGKIDAFLDHLKPGTAWLRSNWGLSRTNELNQHPARALPRLASPLPPSSVWLRVEHQALVALPETGGVLFAIRIAQHPLAEVEADPAARVGLARALQSMPESLVHYKGLASIRRELTDWLLRSGAS